MTPSRVACDVVGHFLGAGVSGVWWLVFDREKARLFSLVVFSWCSWKLQLRVLAVLYDSLGNAEAGWVELPVVTVTASTSFGVT